MCMCEQCQSGLIDAPATLDKEKLLVYLEARIKELRAAQERQKMNGMNGRAAAIARAIAELAVVVGHIKTGLD